ncbi:hypothetical protein QQ020_23320 [Fulvivirgaceae bacterium BMA12]|uniref:Restriction endonuclease n=1 Tax=Agaribacillus aureus TaxID=3051825 RepID=A0ABT8LF92_9BACT|nr:hypothetical protein [Fulvivirgaceae bacterium BMA12]
MIDKIFEEISENIWHRIKDSELCGIRQGEETITDHILLELFRKQTPNIQIIQTPKIQEKNQGTDWEWWIGSHQHGWLRYAVQAKKLKSGKNYYGSLNHLVGQKGPKPRQIDVLKRYSKKNKAIPLYCFYNHVNNLKLEKFWNCELDYEKLQFGWTYTPLEIVELALNKKGRRNFQYIHFQKKTLPMRCLVKCPNILRVYHSANALRPYDFEDLEYLQRGYHRSLPSIFGAAIETGKIVEFPPDLYNPETNLYPKRIGIINNDEEITAANSNSQCGGD